MTVQATTPAAYELLAIKTEYAVRTWFGQDEQILTVPDETIQHQRIAELIDQGQHAEPVHRTVTAWRTDDAALARIRREVAREAIIATAQRFWEEETGEADALSELRPHAPTMSDHRRAELLGELVSELEHQEDVDEDRVAPGPGEDEAALVEDAERRVTEAADALYGGAA